MEGKFKVLPIISNISVWANYIHTESVVIMHDEDYEEKLWREERIRKTDKYLESIKDQKEIYERWLDRLRKEEE